MRYILEGDGREIARIRQYCRLLEQRGVIKFTPADSVVDFGDTDTKAAPAADDKTPKPRKRR